MKIDKQNIFFASDFHLGHANVIKHDDRPFENVDDMHHAIIENWNAVVGKDDLTFFLGDLYYKCHWTVAKEIVDQMNGRMHAIMGNHDRYKYMQKLDRFERIYGDDTALGGATIHVKDGDANRGWQTIVMCHYMIFSWNKGHYGAWHLHGHSHQSIAKNPNVNWLYDRKVLDMGCNGWEYSPVSYQRIKEEMATKIIKPVDHHE